jgi:hypothetical protein
MDALKWVLGVLGAPPWGGFAALLAVALAVYGLWSQTKAQRVVNRVSYHLHQEDRWTRRLEWLLRVAAANVAMSLGADRVILDSVPQTDYQRARGDMMVALAGFAADELPESRALTNAEVAQQYKPLREAATVEIARETKAAMAARDEATAALERLIAGRA